MTNKEIAKRFNEIADLLELKGENPFRIRAYRKAAQNIESLGRDISEIPETERKKIPGIGKDLAGKISEFIETGGIKALDELREEIPQGLLEIISIPGVGPKTAKNLYDNLGITDIETLEGAARGGGLLKIPGIKEKTVNNILRGIELLKKGRERRPIGDVMPQAEEIVSTLKSVKGVGKIALAGSLRRWKETIKDIDILVTSSEPERVMDAFVTLPGVTDVIQKGTTRSSIRLSDDLQVDLRVVENDSFGAALQYFTGSKEHNIHLRELAQKKGLKINEYGIFDEKTDRKLGGKTEEEIYNLLGLEWIPPELREDTGEIDAAKKGDLPELVKLEDIKGDLHIHSRWSDGSYEIADLAAVAKKMGYQYIAITDHSKGLGIAGGLTEEKILEQKREVDTLNKRLKNFRIFMGVEVDIRSDGSLDLSEDVLKQLDFVVASVHSGFRQDIKQMTKRVISAIKCPYVDLIAHPTGRLIGEREPYEINMDEVFRVARKEGKALEINAFPQRLDINDKLAREAKRHGIPVIINTDSHIPDQFLYMKYGVQVARRGWLEKENVLNTLPLNEFEKLLQKRRKKLK
ncbi:MAG: DNA polymerase/3'-5' exonuclease PolX [Nitrospirae bacterium]|nr:MAG: DNA polymerase/3'-5' exonuclease PolX [Nitrospirota bacterium]